MRYQLSDLTPIASFGDLDLLLVLNEDVSKPSIRCCQIDLDQKKIFFFHNIETVLRSTPYEEVPEIEWEFFRNWIARKMPNDKIVEILQGFDTELNDEREI